MTNGGDIICDGYQGCRDISLDVRQSGTSNVYCLGTESCLRAIIEGNINGNGIVYCGTLDSCMRATINNVETLYVSGISGASNANVNGVSNIYVTGAHGMSEATVNSGGVGNMNLYIGSSNYFGDDGATINCERGDFCKVYCQTERSCDKYELNGVCSNYEIICGWTRNVTQWMCPIVTDDISNCSGMISKKYFYFLMAHIFIFIIFCFLFFVLFCCLLFDFNRAYK